MAVKILSLVFASAILSLTNASPHAIGVISRQSAPGSSEDSEMLRIDPTADKKYIISLHDGVTYDEAFLEELSSAVGGSVELETDLSGAVFNGLSVVVKSQNPNEAEIESSIASLPAVQAVARNDPLEAPPANITGMAFGTDLDTRSKLFAREKARFPNSNIMVQADQLHDLGLTGKGIKVAIVDYAVDGTHPGLNVAFTHDYRHPDDIADPDPQCNLHATACGSVVSSKGPNGINVGVAPGVELGNYIIGGCHHGNTATAIQAMEQAVTDKTNILSISLAWGPNWKFLEESRMITKVAEAGVLVVLATGNAGKDGLFRTKTSCATPGVLCVGMTENTVRSQWKKTTQLVIGDDSADELVWRQSKINGGWPTESRPVWTNIAKNAGGWDNQGGNGCVELPEDTPDLSDYIVLVRRNLCNEDDMIDRVAKAGAKYILIAELSEAYPELFDPDIRLEHPDVVSLATVSGVTGSQIARALRAGKRVEINPGLSLQEEPIRENGQQIPARMSGISQWGPTFDAGVATDVVAPGVDIPILMPVGHPDGLYGFASGTSFATPLVAGIAALVMEGLSTKDPATITRALISTARPLKLSYATDLSSNVHQGAGLVQPVEAIDVSGFIDVDAIEFNDTNYRSARSFTISNRGSQDITYDLKSIPAATFYTFNSEAFPDPITGDNWDRGQRVDGQATLRFSKSSIQVPANGNATVEVEAQDPPGLNNARLPVWSGFIQLKASDGRDLSVPYMGVAGDLDRVPKVSKIWITNSGASVPSQEIVFNVHNSMGTKFFAMYIVDDSTGKLASENSIVSFSNWEHTGWGIGWRGSAGGDKISAGKYRLRTRSLRAFAQPGSINEDDYLIVASEPFTFTRDD